MLIWKMRHIFFKENRRTSTEFLPLLDRGSCKNFAGSAALAEVCSLRVLFRLDALAKALSVVATATWLGGWLGGWVAVCLSQPVLYQND